MTGNDEVALPDLANDGEMANPASLLRTDDAADERIKRSAQDLEAVFDVPVTVSAVLGKSGMEVSQLLKLGKGTVVVDNYA